MMKLLTEQDIVDAFGDNLESIIDKNYTGLLSKLEDAERMLLKYIAYVNKGLIEKNKDEISRFVAFINEALLCGDELSLYGEQRNSLKWIDEELRVNTDTLNKNHSSNKYYSKTNFEPIEFSENLAKNLLYIDRISLNNSFLASESCHDYYREILLRNKILQSEDITREKFGLIKNSTIINKEIFTPKINITLKKGIADFEKNEVQKWSREEVGIWEQQKESMYDSLYSLQHDIYANSSSADQYNITREKVFEGISINSRDNDMFFLSEMLWKFTGDIETDPAFTEERIEHLLSYSNCFYISSGKMISDKLKGVWFEVLNQYAVRNPNMLSYHLNQNEAYLWQPQYFKELNQMIKTLANNKGCKIELPPETKIEEAILQERSLNQVKKGYADINPNEVDDYFFKKSKLITYEISKENLIVYLRYKNYLDNPFFNVDNWLDEVNPIFENIGLVATNKRDNIVITIDVEKSNGSEIYLELLKESVDIFMLSKVNPNNNEKNKKEFERNLSGYIKERLLNEKLEINNEKKQVSQVMRKKI